MDDKYNSPNIKQIIEKTSLKISNNFILNYLLIIFNSLCNKDKVINQITFFHYMKLPFFITKKIFFSFSENDLLNEHSFIKLMSGLYLGNLLERLTTIFLILDFDHDKIIRIEDVKLILYLFQLINKDYKNETDLSLIDNLINNFFTDKKTLSFKEYLEIIKNNNSDIIFILIILFHKYIPFKEEEIILFNDCQHQKELNKNVKELNPEKEELNPIIPPSKEVFIYCENVLKVSGLIYKEEELSDDENLEELNDFENDWKKIKDSIKENDNNSGFRFNKTISTIHLNIYDKFNKIEKNDFSLIKAITKSSTHLKKVYKENIPNYFGHCNIYSDENSDEHFKNDVYYIGDSIFLFKIFGNGKRNFKVLNKLILLKKVLYLDKDNNSIILQYIIKENPEYLEIKVSDEEKLNEFYNLLLKHTNYRRIDSFYSPHNTIAKGTYGELILSKKKENDEIYAVKIITKNYSLSLEDQSPFHWEMDISQLLTHIYDDNIIKIYDTFESVDHCYIVMEILQGDLYNILRGIEINDKNKLLIIMQISQGIYTLRKFGIIHRDLKLENIGIIDKNQIKIKLFDFGLSKIIGNHEKTNESYGSFFYCPPEVLNNQSYDYKVDIWPFGIIIYYLLFHKFPFETSNHNNQTQEERVKIFIQKVSHLGHIHIDEKSAKNKQQKIMFEILKRTLVKEPEKRSSINEIINILKSS